MVKLANIKSNIAAHRERRYAGALTVASKAVDVLVRRYHARKIVLIGSLAGKKRFGPHSDIDLCVEGITGNRYFQAVGELLLLSEDFVFDLISLEDAGAAMRERARKGKVLYEKG